MGYNFKVSDDHRINDLSFSPGGYVIRVVYNNGNSKSYDKVKLVENYIKKIKTDPKVIEIWADDTLIYKK